MNRKITLILLNNSGSPIKQATLSKTLILVTVLFIITGIGALSFTAYKYQNLRQALTNARMLEKRLKVQQKEISNQRNQIQSFAKQINTLKAELIGLNNFERKIRIIANAEVADDQNNLFGVGGSIPEDLDAEIPIATKHHSLIREMHDQINQLQTASKNQEKGYEALFHHLESQRNLLAATPAIRPTRGWVTSRFGRRISPFTGRREFHKGLDIAAREGTPIVATANGVVTYAKKKGLLGLTMIIDHGHGVITRYGHCKKFLKKRGDKVKRGDKIATVGNTGRSTGPHVHYEVRINGVPVNPTKYILN